MVRTVEGKGRGFIKSGVSGSTVFSRIHERSQSEPLCMSQLILIRQLLNKVSNNTAGLIWDPSRWEKRALNFVTARALVVILLEKHLVCLRVSIIQSSDAHTCPSGTEMLRYLRICDSPRDRSVRMRSRAGKDSTYHLMPLQLNKYSDKSQITEHILIRQ